MSGQRGMNMAGRGVWLPAVVAAVVLGVASQALADRLWIGRLAAQDVTFRGVEGEEIVYFVGGRERRTPLDDVVRIELPGQPQLSQAEEAYQSADWARAAEAYDRVLTRQQPEPWVRRRATLRLVDASARAGLFPQAASGYVALVTLDASRAAGRQPDPAGATPAQLDAARERVRAGVAGAGEDARRQLLSFLLQLDNARGDREAATRTVNELAPLMGDLVPEARDTWPTFARVTLGRATLALDAGTPADAATLIERASPTFVTPQLRAEALATLARAAEAGAGDDRGALLDAAYAHLRTVTHASDVPAVAAAALVAAGDIHRRLGLEDGADALYRLAIRRHADAPAAADARTRLDERGGAG